MELEAFTTTPNLSWWLFTSTNKMWNHHASAFALRMELSFTKWNHICARCNLKAVLSNMEQLRANTA
jgi:hypothetical protein